MRASRDEWQKRVRQWEASGLTAEAYAAQSGLNAKTLENWKYKLRRQARSRLARRAARGPTESRGPALPLVELPALAVSLEQRFEVELVRGMRVRVPSSFEADKLRRLLLVLEGLS